MAERVKIERHSGESRGDLGIRNCWPRLSRSHCGSDTVTGERQYDDCDDALTVAARTSCTVWSLAGCSPLGCGSSLMTEYPSRRLGSSPSRRPRCGRLSFCKCGPVPEPICDRDRRASSPGVCATAQVRRIHQMLPRASPRYFSQTVAAPSGSDKRQGASRWSQPFRRAAAVRSMGENPSSRRRSSCSSQVMGPTLRASAMIWTC